MRLLHKKKINKKKKVQQRQELQKVYQYERVNMIYSLSTVFNHTLTNEQDNERMNMAHNRVNIIYG